MEVVKRHRLTGLAVILGLILLALAVAFGVGESEDLAGWQQALGVLMTGVPGLALLGGLWYLRSGRLPVSVCTGAIVLGLVAAMVWWWMLVPPIVALVVFWFGVVKRGLVRELATS